jgi:hypothetical protein
MAIDSKKGETEGTKKSRNEKVLCWNFHASIERLEAIVLGAEGNSGQLRDVEDAEIRYTRGE